jgi:hypothetical protein
MLIFAILKETNGAPQIKKNCFYFLDFFDSKFAEYFILPGVI